MQALVLVAASLRDRASLEMLILLRHNITDRVFARDRRRIWKLEITDSANNSPHQLTSWSLKVWDQDDVPPVIEAPTATQGADVE